MIDKDTPIGTLVFYVDFRKVISGHIADSNPDRLCIVRSNTYYIKTYEDCYSTASDAYKTLMAREYGLVKNTIIRAEEYDKKYQEALKEEENDIKEKEASKTSSYREEEETSAEEADS